MHGRPSHRTRQSFVIYQIHKLQSTLGWISGWRPSLRSCDLTSVISVGIFCSEFETEAVSGLIWECGLFTQDDHFDSPRSPLTTQPHRYYDEPKVQQKTARPSSLCQESFCDPYSSRYETPYLRRFIDLS